MLGVWDSNTKEGFTYIQSCRWMSGEDRTVSARTQHYTPHKCIQTAWHVIPHIIINAPASPKFAIPTFCPVLSMTAITHIPTDHPCIHVQYGPPPPQASLLNSNPYAIASTDSSKGPDHWICNNQCA
eukprot:GHVO01009650.1.p2 GENE.GHVO01009650.1~~GHVO01009650.1.p2  ORF type:complete len:127 (-),score=8.51 GHVO01009650.1:15-395(-)